uniref:hypothetical protein n=1 Tax=Pseudomonas sp. TaxID=306 RepID=UPI004054839D
MIGFSAVQRVEELFGLEFGAFSGSNFFSFNKKTDFETQAQTNDVFSEKWISYNESAEKENLYQLQRDWYLSLYGFSSETELGTFLRQQ